MTDEEFSSHYLTNLGLEHESDIEEVEFEPSENPIDWRDLGAVGPVKN